MLMQAEQQAAQSGLAVELMRCLMPTVTALAIIYWKKQEIPRWTSSCIQYDVLPGSTQVHSNSNGPIMAVALKDTEDLQGAGLFWSACSAQL